MAKNADYNKGSNKQQAYVKLGKKAEAFANEVLSNVIPKLTEERDAYKLDSDVLKVALSYLDDGTLKVEEDHEKQFGAKKIGGLEKVVKFNKKLQEAENKPPKVVTETKTVYKTKTVTRKTTDTPKYKKLQSEKDALEISLKEQLEAAEKRYTKAEYALQKLGEFRDKPLSEYEAAFEAMKAQQAQEQSGEKPKGRKKKDAYDKLIAQTFYPDGKEQVRETLLYIEDLFSVFMVGDTLDAFFEEKLNELDDIVKFRKKPKK